MGSSPTSSIIRGVKTACRHLASWLHCVSMAKGLLRELNPGPLAPEARIMPLDQAASWKRAALAVAAVFHVWISEWKSKRQPVFRMPCVLRCSDLANSCQPKTTPVGFEPTRGDPIGLAGRRLNRSAKVSLLWSGMK